MRVHNLKILNDFADAVVMGEKTFEKGHEIFWEIAHNPLKIFLVFPYIRYIILLVWYRLFKKKS